MMSTKQTALMSISIAGHRTSLDQDLITLMKLRKSKGDMVETTIAENDGKIVHRTDDTYFVGFPKPLSALNCAFAIESTDNETTSGEEQFHKINLQIGLHYGHADEGGMDFQRTLTIAQQAGHGEVSVSEIFMNRFDSKYGVNSLRKSNIPFGADNDILSFHIVNPILLPRKKLINKKTVSFGAIAGVLALIFAFFGMIFEGSQTDFVRELFTSKSDNLEVASSSLMSHPAFKIDSNRVAVLPLRNLTGNEGMKCFSEGLAENVIFRLSQIHDLYLYPLSDVLAIEAEQKTPAEVRAALGAKYLVQGSYQLEGNSLMVFIEVIDAESRERISSEKLIGVKNKSRDLNQRIAKSLLFPILGRVSGEAQAALAAFSSTSDFAGDLYLQARYAQRNAVSWEDQQRVLKLCESAINGDSGFALARAHLSEAYAEIHGTWQNDTTWVAKAKYQAKIAVSLSPDLPEAHFALGRAFEIELDYKSAEATYHNAINLRPGYRSPRDALGNLYDEVGRYDEALSLLNQSLELSRVLGDRRSEGDAHNLIGIVHSRRSDNKLAMESYNNSLALRQEIGDRRGEANCLGNIGSIYKDIGECLRKLFKSSGYLT